jgi:hypothetical protein
MFWQDGEAICKGQTWGWGIEKEIFVPDIKMMYVMKDHASVEDLFNVALDL